METTALQKFWMDAADHCGLSVEVPFVVEVRGMQLTVPVLLRGYGSRLGMLVVTDFQSISPYSDELVALGYGYSCLAESREPYDPRVHDGPLFEMLEDWGWGGVGDPPHRRPGAQRV